MRTRPITAVLLSVTATLVVAPLVPGCGEAEPPPMEAKDLEAAQKKQMEIIQKEYGPRAVKKGSK